MKRRRLDTYSNLTPDERRKAARLAAQELRELSMLALATDEGWLAFLEARLRHGYSWRNCALIAYQRPSAVQLATYSQWRAGGFQVQTDEHSTVSIVAPNPKGGFRSVRLFDVAQTDCPLEDDPYGPAFQAELADLIERFPVPEPEQAIAAASMVDRSIQEVAV